MLSNKQLNRIFLLIFCFLGISLLTLKGAVEFSPKSFGANFYDSCTENWSAYVSEMTSTQESNMNDTQLARHTVVESNEPGLYLFSALKVFCPLAASERKTIVVTGWKQKAKKRLTSFRCCFHHKGRIMSAKASLRKTRYRYGESYFNGIQCLCPISFTPSSITKVSLIGPMKMCSRKLSHYIHVETVSPRKVEGVVLCAKVLYGNVEASRFIEWLEAQIFLGITKILCYVHKDLNTDALEVLKYYEKQGVVTAFSFDVPDNETYPRQLWEKTKTAWTDAGIAVMDCQQRMSEYKYGLFIDIDEILIPEGMELQNSIPRYLEKEFLSNTSIGLIKFPSMMHITSWGPSNQDHPLYFGRYLNSTKAIEDRTKYAFRPEAGIPGSCLSHSCRLGAGYKYKKKLSAKVHHFRSCREEWMEDVRNTDPYFDRAVLLVKKPSGNICTNFKRIRSKKVEMLADQIKDRVLSVRSLLNGTLERRGTDIV